MIVIGQIIRARRARWHVDERLTGWERTRDKWRQWQKTKDYKLCCCCCFCVCVWRKSEEESVRSDMKGRSQNVFPREWKYFSQTEHGAFSYLSGPPIMHRLKCNSFHWRKRWAREGGDEGWKVLRRAEHSSVWSAGLAEEIRVGGWEKKARKQRGKLRR